MPRVRGARGRGPAFGGRVLRDGQAEEQKGTVPAALLKNARKSGQLNLSSRGLTEVPETVWSINQEGAGPDKGPVEVSLDHEGERWWEETELQKLILASNFLTALSPDICLLDALTVLDVHDNRLTALPEEIAQLKQLQHFNVSHNQLRVLPPWVGELGGLNTLSVAYNLLAVMGGGVTRLTRLVQLDASHNKLSGLAASVGHMTSVRRLDVSHNAIEALPQDIGKLVALEEMNASYNQLRSLPPSMEQLGNMTVLMVNNNKLESLPPLNNCKILKELHAGFNWLSSVDASFLTSLPGLKHLDLRDNKLEELPSAVVGLQALQRLDLTNNGLSVVPFEMGDLENLKFLGLDGNPMRGIRRDILARGTQEVLKYLRSRKTGPAPSESGDSPRLKSAAAGGVFGQSDNEVDPHDLAASKSLDLSNRGVSSVPLDVIEAAMKAGIQRADLSKNKLQTFPDSFVGVSDSVCELNLSFNALNCLGADTGLFLSLTHLDASGNRLTSLPAEMDSLRLLRHLNISFNRLPSVPAVVYGYKKLEELLVSDNKISAIDVESLTSLPVLGVLDLSNNDIRDVPPQLGNITSLRALQLGGNAFKVPRPAQLAKGTTAILEYLRSRIPQ